MAGYENIRDANNKRTPEERRELAKKAGKASGQARRRKADFRKTLNLLLTAEIDNEEWKPVLESLGVECTLESALLMAQIKMALAGDTQAAKFVAQYSGQSARAEEDLENKKADTELIKARKEAITGENENDEALDRLDQILKEVRDLNEEFIGAIHKETPAHPGRRMAETGQHGKTFCGGVRRRSEQCIPDLGESEGGGGSGTSPQSLAPDTPGI